VCPQTRHKASELARDSRLRTSYAPTGLARSLTAAEHHILPPILFQHDLIACVLRFACPACLWSPASNLTPNSPHSATPDHGQQRWLRRVHGTSDRCYAQSDVEERAEWSNNAGAKEVGISFLADSTRRFVPRLERRWVRISAANQWPRNAAKYLLRTYDLSVGSEGCSDRSTTLHRLEGVRR
jgi:hypothetical protein